MIPGRKADDAAADCPLFAFAFAPGLLGGEAIKQPVAARAAQVGLAAAAVGAARGMR